MSFGNVAGAVLTCVWLGSVDAFKLLDAPSADATALLTPPCNAVTRGARSAEIIGYSRPPSSPPSDPVSCRLALSDADRETIDRIGEVRAALAPSTARAG